MWPVGVVIQPPVFNLGSSIVQADKNMLVEAFIPELAVEARAAIGEKTIALPARNQGPFWIEVYGTEIDEIVGTPAPPSLHQYGWLLNRPR